MKFLNWLKQLFGYEFPEPKQHNLSLQSFFDFYHKKLNSKWRGECKILVYRMDPAKAPFTSFMELEAPPTSLESFMQIHVMFLMPSLQWWMEHGPPDLRVGQTWKAVFCIRLQRTWKTEYGSRTQEICISTFEVNR